MNRFTRPDNATLPPSSTGTSGFTVLSLSASILALVAYALTMDRGVDFHDYGDFQTVPFILGIPYPTGYPGFVLFGWIWSHGILVGDVAFTMNLLSVFASAGSVFVIAQIARESGCGWFAGTVAALLFAGGFSTWSHAGIGSPHVLGELCIFAALLFAVRARRSFATARNVQYSLVAGGLALAFDNTTLLCLPGVAVVLYPYVRPVFRANEVRFGAVTALCIVVGAYAYLPARSLYVTAHALDPTRELGLPPGGPFWDDRHPGSPEGFLRVVTGREYDTLRTAVAVASPARGRYWFVKSLDALGTDVTRVFAYLLPIGCLVLFLRSRHLTCGYLLFACVPLVFMFSYALELDPSRYVPRALGIAAIFLALLVDAALQYLKSGQRWLAIPVALSTLVLTSGALLNDAGLVRRTLSQRSERDARPFARFLENVTPSDAIVISDWAECTPLAYERYVKKEGSRFVLCGVPETFAARLQAWSKERVVFYVGSAAQRKRPNGFRRMGRFGPRVLWEYARPAVRSRFYGRACDGGEVARR